MSILNEPIAPWSVRLSQDDAAKAIELLKVKLGSEAGADLRVIDGEKCRSVDGMFKEFESVYEFPFFGNNLNALQDCLADLSWLEATPTLFVVLIVNGSSFLAEEPPDRVKIVLHFLDLVAEEWATPVERGEWWDRGAVPFHLVFQLSTHKHEQLMSLPLLEL